MHLTCAVVKFGRPFAGFGIWAFYSARTPRHCVLYTEQTAPFLKLLLWFLNSQVIRCVAGKSLVELRI